MTDFKTSVVQLYSHEQQGSCSLCPFVFSTEDYLAKATEHLMNKHGMFMKHAGQESVTGEDGKPWQVSTIILAGVTPDDS